MKPSISVLNLLLIPLSLFGLTIEQAVQTSLDTNPQMQKRISEYKSTRYDVDKAKAGYKPTVEISGAIGPEHTERKAPTPNQTFDLTRKEASLVVTENLFKGFNTENNVLEQESRLQTYRYYTMQEANALTLRTVQGYLGVIKNKHLLDLEYENVKTHERIHKMIREKTAAGYGRRADLEQSEARMVLSYANYIAQQNNYQDAIINFERIYGQIIPAESMLKPSAPSLPADNLEALIHLALTHSPTLQVEHSNVKTQKARYKKEKSSFYPNVDAELSADYQNDIDGYKNDDRSYRAMLKLYYNLYNGGGDEATRLQNLQIITSHQLSLNEQERAVAEKVKLAWMSYQYYSNRIRCLRMHVELSKKTAGSYAEEYLLGRRTLLDLLNVELEYTTARKELATAEDGLLYASYRILESLGLVTYALDANLYQQIGLTAPDNITYAPLRNMKLTQYGDTKGYLDITDVCQKAFEPIVQVPIIIPEIETMINKFPESRMTVPEPVPAPVILPKADKTATRAIIIDETVSGSPNVTFADIHFAHNSAVLSPQSKQEIIPLVEKLRSNPAAYLDIHGHTDNVGPEWSNKRLSRLRAESAKAVLVEQGISEDRVHIFAHGLHKPIADNATEDGRRLNRRIEFIIKETKGIRE
ncbi:MAG: hypothetical protein JU82_11630 [Sulfuricurvum sp. MLSB]|uniref:TolC family outer membrane protein n=3 Tax=unclassified Sulfuricurvum TaxID=2632390 RepID=UPI000501C32F|nr:TolC family outer membrane protein [Sulfuricurvum sp. MLSB]KFN38498.1 MAG: hypothetical protein JU82_11630 [Sulfuricurvum sp. MLSB]